MAPFIRILSLNDMRWGDVYKPVLSPERIKADEIIAATEPLPFVPAM
jgi:hypothetical protein